MSANNAQPVPVIIDTDLGDDIDDTWALAMALNSPELDVRFVLTAGPGKHLQRAAMAAKLLGIAGHAKVPIGLGCQATLPFLPVLVGGEDTPLYQDRWVAGYDLKTDYAGTVHENGVQAMIDLIMAHEGPVPLTIIAIAPLGNVAEALRIEPAIAGKCKFIGMHGSIHKGYYGSDNIHAEYNVLVDPDSCRDVLRAKFISKTLTPLDTCGSVLLKNDLYDSVLTSTSPTARAIIESFRMWSADLPKAHPHKRSDPDRRSTVLFDCVAIFLAFSENWLAPLEENCSLVVTSDGYTLLQQPGATKAALEGDETEQLQCNNIRLALAWTDLDAFHKDLARRVIGPSMSSL